MHVERKNLKIKKFHFKLTYKKKKIKGDYIDMEVLYEVRGENLFIYLPEELDHHNSKIITEQSDWYIVSNHIRNIIFNFKNTNFMDSSGIGVIMGRYKLIKTRGGNITVTNINNAIDRILTISGLYKIVNKTEMTNLAEF